MDPQRQACRTEFLRGAVGVLARLAVLVGAVSVAGGCAASAPQLPAGADPVLVQGERVFAEQCARCHGASGQGGLGDRIDGGRTVERFPDPADQADFVRQGRKGMPPFEDRLSDDEIEAVVRYTREVL